MYKYHKTNLICMWRNQYGLKLREGETYEIIYEKVQDTTHCELCNVELISGRKSNSRCMDHDHETGYFRYVLCNTCNKGYKLKHHKRNKTGHRWICPWKQKKKDKIYHSFTYKRKGFKVKTSQSLTKLIALSFINLLKKPL